MGAIYYRHSSKTASRLVADEVVIVRLPEAEMTILNQVGSLVWSLADGQRSAEDLARAVQAECGFDTAPDLSAFLQELVAHGLLETMDTPAASPCPCPPPPVVERFESPAIRVAEPMETLAGTCPSAFTGEVGADCRTIGLGCFDFNT